MRLFEPMLFRNGRPAAAMDRLGADDPAAVVALHEGHFALHERDGDGSDLLVRDLLGVHKLFFAVRDGEVEASNYLVDLLRAGHPCSDVFSVPAGHLVRLDPRARSYELARWGALRFGPEPGTAPTLEEHAARIRDALDLALEMIAGHCKSRPVYVTLSGGVDSTTIAALAREHIPDLRALTFALRNERETGPGADLHFARRVVADLGLRHVEVLAEPDEVLLLLDDVLVRGQDFRDFNVHCGLVNAAIGRAIAELHPEGPRPVVLSGDMMNEFVADYAPVRYRGREYFGLPRLDPGVMRRFLVGGLDSGDREVGILQSFGVEAVQPYALCARALSALPSALTHEPGFKAELVRAVTGDRVPEYVRRRAKVRAQVAVEGEPGGILALLVDRGIDQACLKHLFARLLGIGSREADGLVRAGHYRFATSYPGLPASSRRDAWNLRSPGVRDFPQNGAPA